MPNKKKKGGGAALNNPSTLPCGRSGGPAPRTPRQQEQCKYTSAKLKVADYEKEINLLQPPRAGMGKGRRAIQILAGHKTKKAPLNITVAGPGPCGSHSNKVFDVDFTASDKTVTINSNTNTTLSASLCSRYELRSFFTKEDLLLRHTPDQVTVSLGKCGSSNSVLIEIFPGYEYTISGSVNFGEDEVTMDNDNSGEHEFDWSSGFEVSGKREYHGNTLELKKEFDDAFKENNAINDLHDKINKWTRVNLGPATLTISLPKIEVSGSWGYEEDEEEFTVGKKGKASVEADPIIGVGLSLDLLEAGLEAAGLGWVEDLKNLIKDASGGRAEVELEVTIGVEGKLGFKVELELSKDPDPEVETTGSMELSLEVKASAKMDAWVFKASAEGSASAKAGFELKLEMEEYIKPAGTMSFNFTGVDITLKAGVALGIGDYCSLSKEYEKSFTPIEECEIWSKDFDLN